MSILMAITGTEIRGLRLLGLTFSFGLVAAAIASGRIELLVLHSGLAAFHIQKLTGPDAVEEPELCAA